MKEERKRYDAGLKAFCKAMYEEGQSPVRAAMWGMKVASGLKREATCNNCGKSDTFTLFMKTRCSRIGIPLTAVQCECGLVFLNPQPDKSLGIKYFEKAYSGQVDASYFNDEQTIIKRNQERFDIISHLPAPDKTILDFGAGMGFFVDICLYNRWSVAGVEQSEKATDYAWEKFRIVFRHISSLKKHNFNIITLWDVIEHLPNPKGTLLMLKEYLTPGGHIVIETANINSHDFKVKRKKWSFWLMDHFYYYSEKTLSDLLESVGFTILRATPSKKKHFKPIRSIRSLIYRHVSPEPIMIVTAKLN